MLPGYANEDDSQRKISPLMRITLTVTRGMIPISNENNNWGFKSLSLENIKSVMPVLADHHLYSQRQYNPTFLFPAEVKSQILVLRYSSYPLQLHIYISSNAGGTCRWYFIYYCMISWGITIPFIMSNSLWKSMLCYVAFPNMHW